MANTYSPLLRLILQEDQSNRNLWGTIFNNGAIELLEEAMASVVEVDATIGDQDLTAQNGLSDDARPMFIHVTGNPGAAITLTVPTLSKMYVVINETSPAQSVFIATTLSTALEVKATDTPSFVFVDAANDQVRSPGRADSILPMSAWTAFTLTINNATAGDTTLACRYAKQGHLVFFEIPSFNTTVSTGVLTFAETLPAAIRPGTALGNGGLTPAVQFPCWINGAAAGVEWAFTAQANGTVLFSNIGTGSVAAPDTYDTVAKQCYVWSTRGP